MDRLPSREELELQSQIRTTNQQIVRLADSSGTNLNRLPEDVQQGIREARKALRED